MTSVDVPASRRRYPYAALAAFLSAVTGLDLPDPSVSAPGFLTQRRIARMVGVRPATVGAWAHRGTIGEPLADTIATRLGVHPARIWPEWWDVPTDRLATDADRADRLAAKRARAAARQQVPA